MADEVSESDRITLRTTTSLCGDRIHLHQLVRKPQPNRDTKYVVVGCNENSVEVIDPSFQFDREEVSPVEWQVDEYEAVYVEDGAPYYAY